MFDQVKQNVGKWTRGSEEPETTAAAAVEAAPRPRATRMSNAEPATIGPSIRIKGELTGEENLVIEGSVEGTIHLEKNDLTIGTNGRIKADIHAKGVVVEGELQGDIVGTEKVIIRRSGNMRGNIVAPRVTLEDGAMFKGSIEMEPGPQRQTGGDASVGTLPRGAAIAEVSVAPTKTAKS